MIRSLNALALRQVATRRLRAVLTAFGIVLGVGMVFGVLLLVGTIRTTFDELIDSAWGTTDLVAMPASGRLPEDAVERIRATEGVDAAGGMVGAALIRLDANGKAVKGVSGQIWAAGYDPGQHRPYDFTMVAGREARSGSEVWLDRKWADDAGLEVGETVSVMAPVGRTQLRVVGLFEFASGLSFGGAGLAGVPLEHARRIMDAPEGWNQVSIVVTDRGDTEAVQKRLSGVLGAGVDVKTPSAFGDDVADQLQALNVILYFFSGVALFVGGFLILNSFNMTVLQRMREIGTLRTLGAGRGDIVRSVLVEALALGVAGTVLGLGLGLGLALVLIEAMGAMNVPIGGLTVTPQAVILSIVLGILVTLAGAAWPAVRAARVAPIRAVLGQGHQRTTARRGRLVAGVALFVPGLVFGGDYWFGGDTAAGGVGAVIGIAGTMAMFAGLVAAAPFVITPLVRVLAWPLRRVFPTSGRLAGDASRANPVRTAATAAALTIGLSVIVVNSAFSTSFMHTLDRQLTASLARDLTVRPTGTTIEMGGAQVVPAGLRDRIAALPEAGTVTPVRAAVAELPHLENKTMGLLVGVDPAAYGRVDRTEVAGVSSRDAALRGVADGGVLIGKAYAKAAGVEVGGSITLRGPRGVVRAPIVGRLDALVDYGGMLIQMSHETMKRTYGISGDAELVVTARSPEQRADLEHHVTTILDRDYPAIEAVSTKEFKETAQEHVDQQFALFNGITAIAVIVSLLGVVNTLAMSVLERTREIGLLRALGSSRWLVRLTMIDEGVLMTLAGALAGIASGSLIAWFWIASAGDVMPGMSFAFPWGTALVVSVLAIVFGVVAAALPARRAARLDPVQALTYE